MASNRFEPLYRCVACEEHINRLSKCLPCLHSICQSCFSNTLDETNTSCTCPKCHAQFVDWKDFGVSPIIAKELMRLEFDSSSKLKCDWCSEDGISSVAEFWCGECRKLLCDHCIRYHKKLLNTHISKDLDAMQRSDIIDLVMRMQNTCVLHRKQLEMYCEGCGNCYCDKCFAMHANDPMTPCTNVTSLRVHDEVVKRKEQFPTLGHKMTSFEQEVNELTENILRFVSEFKSDCEIKRVQIWSDYESICEKAKRDALRLNEQIDDGMQEILAKCHRMKRQNDEILQEISTWRLNFDYLRSKYLQDVETFRGIRMLEKQCPVLRHNLPSTETPYEILVEFPDYWCETIDSLQNENNAFVTFKKVGIKIQKINKENRFDLPKAKKYRSISSIFVNQKDEHIFVCDRNNNSLIEIKKNGEIQTEFQFFSVTNDESFEPFDICFISSENIFVVCGFDGNKNLLFLKRKTILPFFQLTNFFKTKTNFVSLFERNEQIFVLDEKLKIHSFSKKCEKLNIFQIEAFQHLKIYPFLSRIRFDFLNENIWFSNVYHPKLICLDLNFKQINWMEKERQFLDFHFNKFGQFFLCDENEFVCFPNQKLFQFEEKQNFLFSRIFVLEKKCLFLSKEMEKLVSKFLKFFIEK